MAYYFPYELVKLSTKTAGTTVSFTSEFTSNFTNYYVKIRGVQTVTDNVHIIMTFSVNNGSSYLSTGYKSGISYDYATFNSGGTSSIRVLDTSSNSSTRGSNIDLTLYNLLDTSQVKVCYGWNGYYSSDAASQYESCCGVNTGTTAVNAIKFASSSGNLQAGTFTLYGIQEP